MALRNPLGRIKDATFATLKHPLGAAEKAIGTVGQVSRLITSRRQATAPGPRIPEAAPAPAPAQPAPDTRARAERPDVDATPADVAALVAKKAPARKPAAQKNAPVTRTAAKKSAGRTSTARKAAHAPGDKLPFSRPAED